MGDKAAGGLGATRDPYANREINLQWNWFRSKLQILSNWQSLYSEMPTLMPTIQAYLTFSKNNFERESNIKRWFIIF